MIIKTRKSWEINNIIHFIETFKLEKEFKAKWKYKIEEWKYDFSDYDCIVELLKDLPENYIVYFVDEKDGYFVILKL